MKKSILANAVTLHVNDRIILNGNKALILMSDIGIGVSSSKTALEASQLSILSNPGLMKHEEKKSSIEKETHNKLNQGMGNTNHIMDNIYSYM